MKNPELKRELLINGTFNEYCKKRHELIQSTIDDYLEFYKPLVESFESYDEYADYYTKRAVNEVVPTLCSGDKFDLSKEDFTACEQMRCCKRSKGRELKKHIKFWFDYLDDSQQVVFGTLTFRDDDFKTDIKTRRQYVHRFLNTWCQDYIANIDYGSQNEREHYHFVALIDGSILHDYEYYNKKHVLKHGKTCDQMKFWSNKHGFTHLEIVSSGNKDQKNVSDYINKLSNHSLKVQVQKLIVKRDSEYKRWIKRSKL